MDYGGCGTTQVVNLFLEKEIEYGFVKSTRQTCLLTSLLVYTIIELSNSRRYSIMAGRRRKVVAKNYNELIAKEKEVLAKLETDAVDIRTKIKEKRAEIKKLEKAKVAYDEQKAEEEKAKKMKEVAEMIVASDKSLDEIKEFLGK